MHLNTNENPSEYQKYTGRKIFFISLGLALLLIVFIISISVGAFNIPISDILNTITFHSESKRLDLIIWNIRLPQALTAVSAGIALSIAGLVMQSILNNPLASPFTLGVSNAAAFGAAFSVIIFSTGVMQSKGEIQIINHYATSAIAFLFCMLTAVVILFISKIKRSSPEVMALTGVAIGSLFTAGTMFLQYFATDTQLAAMVFWTFGDVSRASWKELSIIAGVTCCGLIFFVFNTWNYNAMQSGEETAKGLGVNTNVVRITSMLAATLLTSVAVSFLGIIGFVGLVAPHMARRIVGDDHRFLIPASCVIGALLLLSADTAARVAFTPHVLPVAVLTSFVGAPVFIYLLIKGYKR
jgi:iron complex transport system permease protein